LGLPTFKDMKKEKHYWDILKSRLTTLHTVYISIFSLNQRQFYSILAYNRLTLGPLSVHLWESSLGPLLSQSKVKTVKISLMKDFDSYLCDFFVLF